MGGDDSKPSHSQDDFFLLEHLSKMSLTNRKVVSYYLISSQHGPALSPLRQYFKIDTFPSVATLKQEMSFVNRTEIVKVIFSDGLPQSDLEYLQNEPKISQLIGFSTNVQGNKIAGNANNATELVSLLNSLEEKDKLEIPASNMLFTIDQDTKILNKYRLNYHCNSIYNDRASAKADFILLARKLYPEQKQVIDQFEKEYDLTLQGEEKRKMVLDWVFKNNFYFEMVNQLTRNSTDPKRIAYVRLGIKDIYESIQAEYRATKPTQPFFIVIQITQQEKVKLQKSVDNFMLFTSFVKGTLVQKQANKELKSKPNTFRFQVNIYRAEKTDALDFGYIKHDGQILLNIYNVMRVQSSNFTIKIRKAELLYGILPVMDQERQRQQSRNSMTKVQLDLTRNYDYIEDLMGKIDGQATLLQLSGYYKDSLEIYDKKVDFIRKTNQSQDVMNHCLIKKGDALALSGDSKQAQKTYRSVNTSSKAIKVIALIHLADMYMRIDEEEKLESIINELEPLLEHLEKEGKYADQYFKGHHFLAIKAFKKGSHKKAKELLVKLLGRITEVYKHNLEGKPLYHDIYRTMAACQFKLGYPGDALSSLNTTLELQLACEGKTHNVALTESLIQTVSRTSGNQEQLTKSLQRLQAISAQIDSNQTRLSPASVSSINKSMVSINL